MVGRLSSKNFSHLKDANWRMGSREKSRGPPLGEYSDLHTWKSWLELDCWISREWICDLQNKLDVEVWTVKNNMFLVCLTIEMVIAASQLEEHGIGWFGGSWNGYFLHVIWSSFETSYLVDSWMYVFAETKCPIVNKYLKLLSFTW